MSGKNVKLTRNVRIKGKLVKAGEKVPVTKDIEAELLDADAIELSEAKADQKDGE